ncbi:G2/M phase-specific E3 ubiquitin-protein ligase-like isoform X1 [Lineus longissimus]|uniref:G2/M phase-specific E3 ubiquitin-protein ligase-like isoform X1 n=2 Tax=Lineus longissimus TaxID=88925 RepID=UPI00315DAF20
MPIGTKFDGQTVLNLCGQGVVNVMASGQIKDGFDPTLYQNVQDFVSDNDEEELPVAFPDQQLPSIVARGNLGRSLPSSVSPQVMNIQRSDRRIPLTGPTCTTDVPSVNTGTYSQYVDLNVHQEDDDDDDGDREDEALNQAIRASLEDRNKIDDTTTIRDELVLPQSQIDDDKTSKFNVNRRDVFDGAKIGFRRKSYSPFNGMSVVFTDGKKGEGAIDIGGPKREFLRLLMASLQGHKVFEGPQDRKVLALSASALSDGDYQLAGRMIAVSVIHSGPPPGFFSPTLYDCVAYDHDRRQDPTIEDVADLEVRKQLEKIREARDIETLQEAVTEASSFLSLAGCLIPIRTVNDRETIAKAAVAFYVVGRVQSCLECFKDGLRTLGLLATVRQHPTLFKDIFCHQPSPLTAESVEDIFKFQLAEKDSNKYDTDLKVNGWWRDFLQDVQEGNAEKEKISISLSDILIFGTGAAQVPPLGFMPIPSIELSYQAPVDPVTKKTLTHFPTSNTCANLLRLPATPYYSTFKKNMVLGIACSPGFGFARVVPMIPLTDLLSRMTECLCLQNHMVHSELLEETNMDYFSSSVLFASATLSKPWGKLKILLCPL